MSIANRYSIKKSIVEQPPKSLKTKWNLVFFKFPKKIFDDTRLEFFLDELTINSFSKFFDLSLYIYTTKTNSPEIPNPLNTQMYDYLINKYGAHLMEIPASLISNSLKLLIIKKFMDNKQNTICVDTGIGYYIDTGKNHIKPMLDPTNIDIYSDMITEELASDSYQQIAKKMNLNQIINSQFLIIPYSNANKKYIDYAFDIINKIDVNDKDISTNISLSIVGSMFGNKIKNINYLESDGNFLLCVNNKCSINSLRELYNTNDLGKMNYINPKSDLNKINYINPKSDEYIFYPYMDIDAEPENSYSDNHDINIINTNGFYYPMIDNDIKKIMFKRFNDSTHGIYVKKNQKSIIVPHILHYVLLDPSQNNSNAWGRILRVPWTLMTWTIEKIKSDVLTKNSKWVKLYDSENDEIIKLLIIYLSILEKYGGFVIDSSMLPLKIIPDEMLTNKFMLSFYDEKNYGTKLSYRIMASVSGFIENEQKKKINYDAARKPFLGVNNFFIDTRLQEKKSKNDDNNNSIKNSLMFEKMYQLISEKNHNRLTLIEKFFINDPNTYIYPGYYFNPNHVFYPKYLMNRSVSFNIPKIPTIESSTKTDVKRTYKITTSGIIAKLNENPIDRLKNNKTIE